jgi:hypothetical protein
MRKPSVVVAPSSVFASLVAILQARVTDVQILTLALTLLGIFAASWFNNSRTTDIKDVFRAETKALETRMDLQFERMNNKLDTVLKLVADIDTRVTTLESRKL